jgi:threonine dehydratase
LAISHGELAFSDIREAARRLDGVAHRTPVVQSRSFDDRTGIHAYFKCENLQRIGAFKFRGAYNRLVQLSPAEREAGVVAHSSGNHAQAVAFAAKLLDIPATIIMPSDAPKSKMDATRDFGATIVPYERALGTAYRAELAAKICAEKGATLVPPFDDDAIIAGAGTAALELLEEVPNLDAIVCPVGGGGFFSGTCLAARGINPSIELWGVEPELGNDMQQSVAAGSIITIPPPATIADGLQTQMVSQRTLNIVRANADGIVTVSDEELKSAMRFAFERMKLVIEPSGAAAIAAALFDKVPLRGKRVGVMISGGNVDPDRFAAYLS